MWTAKLYGGRSDPVKCLSVIFELIVLWLKDHEASSKVYSVYVVNNNVKPQLQVFQLDIYKLFSLKFMLHAEKWELFQV